MEELANKAIAGDAAAEQQLFAKLLERFRYIAKLRIGEEHCDDLAQEAATTVFEKYKTENFSVSFQAWAHGVLRMKIGNQLQKKKRSIDREADMGEDFDPAQKAPDSDLKRFLLDCLQQLIGVKREYARILNLAHHGFTTAEICERAGITANNYYVTLSRGRVMLKDCLETKGVAL